LHACWRYRPGQCIDATHSSGSRPGSFPTSMFWSLRAMLTRLRIPLPPHQADRAAEERRRSSSRWTSSLIVAGVFSLHIIECHEGELLNYISRRGVWQSCGMLDCQDVALVDVMRNLLRWFLWKLCNWHFLYQLQLHSQIVINYN